MIELKVNGKGVNLKKGERIQITLTTPFFRLRDGIPSGSFNFKLPLDAFNTKEINHPQRLSRYPFPKFEDNFELGFKGKTVMEGVIAYDNTTPNETEAYLGTAVAAFYSRLQESKLADYAYGGPKYVGVGYDVGVEGIWVQGTNINNKEFYVFPVYNRWLYNHQLSTTTSDQTTPADKLDDVKLYSWNTDGVTFDEREILEQSNQNAIRYDYTVLRLSEAATITPFPRVAFMFDSLFKELGYALENNLFTDHPEYKYECMYSNYDWKNDYPSSFTGTCYVELNKFVPDCTVWDFFEHYQNIYNFTIVYNHTNRTARMVYNDPLFQTQPEDISDIVAEGYLIKNINPSTVSLKINHNEGDAFFRGTDIGEKSALYNADFITPTVGVVEGDFAFFTGNQIRPLYVYKSDNTFYFKGDKDGETPTFRLVEYKGGKGDAYEVETNISHPLMSNFVTVQQWLAGIVRNPIWIRTPVVAYPIRSLKYAPEEESPCPLFSMFYRGMHQGGVDTGGNDVEDMGEHLDLLYPYGSVDLRDTYDSANEFEFSLLLKNDNQQAGTGIIDRHWQATFQWMKCARRTVTFPYVINVDKFSNFRFDRLVKINGVAYLPVEVRVDLTDEGFSLAELDVITI